MPRTPDASREPDAVLISIERFVRERVPIDHATEDALTPSRPRTAGISYGESPFDQLRGYNLADLPPEDLPRLRKLTLAGEEDLYLDRHLLRMSHRDVSTKRLARSVVRVTVFDSGIYRLRDDDTARFVTFQTTSSGVMPQFSRLEGGDARDKAAASRPLRGAALQPLLDEVLQLTREARTVRF